MILAAASTTSLVGLLMLAGLATGLVLLFLQRKSRDQGVALFRERHGLRPATMLPAGLRAAMGSGEWACSAATLPTPRGPVESFWLEGSISGSQVLNGVTVRSVDPLLGLALSACTVDPAFRAWIAESQRSVSFWQRHFLRHSPHPLRVETLPSGHVLFVWAVARRTEHYERVLRWVERGLGSGRQWAVAGQFGPRMARMTGML